MVFNCALVVTFVCKCSWASSVPGFHVCFLFGLRQPSPRLPGGHTASGACCVPFPFPFVLCYVISTLSQRLTFPSLLLTSAVAPAACLYIINAYCCVFLRFPRSSLVGTAPACGWAFAKLRCRVPWCFAGWNGFSVALMCGGRLCWIYKCGSHLLSVIFRCCCIAFCVGLGKPDARLILSSWWFIFFLPGGFSLSWKADRFRRLCGSWFLWVNFPRCPHALSVCRFVLFSVSWKFPWIIVWVLTSAARLSSFSGGSDDWVHVLLWLLPFPLFFFLAL